MSRFRFCVLTFAPGALTASPVTMTAGAQPIAHIRALPRSQSLVLQTALATGCRTRIGVFRFNRSGPKPIGARRCGHPPETGGRRICGVVVR